MGRDAPTKPIRASPVLATSKPCSPPPPPPFGVISSRLSLANFAFSRPKCPEVALFFWVRAICEGGSTVRDNAAKAVTRRNGSAITSASIEAIFSRIVLILGSPQSDVRRIVRPRPTVTLLESRSSCDDATGHTTRARIHMLIPP